MPRLSNSGYRLFASSGLTSLLRIQSMAPSTSRARCSGVCPFFFGNMASILRKSPVGSLTSSSWPGFLNQLRESSRSFALSSGVRRDIGAAPNLSKPGMTGSSSVPGVTPSFRIQSRARSISRARSSGDWPFFLGNIWSSLLNSPVGSVRLSSSLPLFLVKFKASSRSLPRCSGVRLVEGTLPNSSNPGMLPSGLGVTPLLRIQSIAPSISRDRCSGV